MSCQFVQRVERLYGRGRVVIEKLTICHEDGKMEHCQFTLQSDPEILSGTGQNPCEALSYLEAKLNILPPPECGGCEG